MHLLKELKKYKLKFKSKLCITFELQKSIYGKNKLLKNFINKKDPILKEERNTSYKKYRNLLSILMNKKQKKNRLTMANILKEIGIILRTRRKEINPLFL